MINPKSNAVVILETGSRGTIDTWTKVLEELSNDVQTIAFVRKLYPKVQMIVVASAVREMVGAVVN